MWPFSLFSRGLSDSPAPLYFTNTLSGKKDLFVPLKPGIVTMYSCGPTVYSRAHIGNIKAAVFSDLVARVLTEAGYHVRRVMNITDVGHLVGDGDHGEDKMAKGAREEELTPEAVAERYAKFFIEDIEALNINTQDLLFPRATEYVKEQIAMIQTLEQKGFAYRASDGIYFDTKQFPNYGKLGNVSAAKLLPGARIEKIPGKRHATDFVLWRDAKEGDLQQWDSPWGRGNPGWHIECSAMIRALLGPEIDIHTGGQDHIPTHHNNEIAQSEAANGRPLARYWLHEAFVNVGEDRLAKSLKNEIYVSDVVEHGYPALALRYFFLEAHFSRPMSFSWEAIGGAAEALARLTRIASEIREAAHDTAEDSDARELFIAAMRDDLATPKALAILWESVKNEELSAEEKWGLIMTADAHLGLSLTTPAAEPEAEPLPPEVERLAYERDLARGAKDYARADDIRYQLEKRGYRVEDGPSGTLLVKDRR